VRQPVPGVQEPTAGEKQRATITHELAIRGVKPAAIAIEAKVSPATVSRVFSGERCDGDSTKRVQALVARILKQPTEKVFVVTKEPVQG
jgi:predicted transcriptional regulator